MTWNPENPAAGGPFYPGATYLAGPPVFAVQPADFGPGGYDQMGGILSTLTFGLLGKKKTPAAVTISHDEIEGQVAALVMGQLQAQGMTTQAAKAKESAGFNINALSAWDRVFSDTSGATTQAIVTQVINDLLASGLITYLPSSGQVGTVTPGAPATGAAPATSPLTLPSLVAPDARSLMIVGGILAAGLVLGKRRHRGR